MFERSNFMDTKKKIIITQVDWICYAFDKQLKKEGEKKVKIQIFKSYKMLSSIVNLSKLKWLHTIYKKLRMTHKSKF